MSSVESVSWSVQALMQALEQQRVAENQSNIKVLSTALDVQKQIGNELVSLIKPVGIGENLDITA